jgi:RNA polymerase sigma factor (TIGR02999 family)
MNDVTRILSAIEQGDPHAADDLLPLVYNELRALARQIMTREKPGQTLQSTALVHEAYLRLVGDEDPGWKSRGHFFAAAAEAMRRILVESARRKATLKRGGGMRRVDLDQIGVLDKGRDEDLVALDEALCLLTREDPQSAELVKLRYFAGLSNAQAAEALGISARTAEFRWAFARAWLLDRIVSPSRGDEARRPKPAAPS